MFRSIDALHCWTFCVRVVHRPAASVPACRKTQPPVAPPLASLAPGRRGWVRGPPPSPLHVSTGDGVRAPATPLSAGARVAAMCNEARVWHKQEVWASRGEHEFLDILDVVLQCPARYVRWQQQSPRRRA